MEHMQTYHTLIEMINKELKVIANKGEFSEVDGDKDLHRVLELTKSLHCIYEIIEEQEEAMEMMYDYGSYNRPHGRMTFNSPHRKSYHSNQNKNLLLTNLHEALNNAVNESDRREIQTCIERVENGVGW